MKVKYRYLKTREDRHARLANYKVTSLNGVDASVEKSKEHNILYFNFNSNFQLQIVFVILLVMSKILVPSYFILASAPANIFIESFIIFYDHITSFYRYIIRLKLSYIELIQIQPWHLKNSQVQKWHLNNSFQCLYNKLLDFDNCPYFIFVIFPL